MSNQVSGATDGDTGCEGGGMARMAHNDGDCAREPLSVLYAAMACGVIVLDTAREVVDANAAAQQIMGLGLEQMCGHRLRDFMLHPTREDGSDLPEEDRYSRRVLETRRAQRDAVMGGTRLDGQHRWLQLDYVPVFGDDAGRAGEPGGQIIVSFIDITARKRAEEALRASAEYFRALSEHSSDLVAILDAEGVYRYASPSHRHILGIAPEEMLGRNALEYVDPREAARIRAVLADRVRDSGVGRVVEVRVRHADGSWRTLELVGNNRLDDPVVCGVIVNGRDITERKRAEEALRRQALHDALTDLPNRTLLQDRLEQAVRVARRDEHSLAFLLLDLDRFKDVNDSFGHLHGDLLLRQVGPRLQGALRASDTVARLGGDEFAVLLPTGDEASATRAARKILAALDTPFPVEGEQFHVGASIGIALFPSHGDDAPTLLRRADVAMYLAKREHRSYAVYAPEHDEHSADRLALIAALHRAIARGELLLHYQPKIALRDGPAQRGGKAYAMEALVRWRHRERGLLPSDRFIPLAEQTGLIVPLTRWVLGEALRECREWRRAAPALGVEVNLSMWSLRNPELAETVAALLTLHGLPAAALRLEMTESALMSDAPRALEALTRLRDGGVRLSIDDFGTGYSSLAYLKRLPVDELKIDKSFVLGMARDETDAAIVRSTIELGHSLGLRVVAEGVEDAESRDLLVGLGCDAAQGYHLGYPLPAADLGRWLATSPYAP